jgi:hypothetical protein
MAYGSVNVDLMTTSDGVSSAGTYGFKNRIINGAMVIDQRNAGASVTPTGDDTYTLDRWKTRLSNASKFSVQQQTSVVPTGFTNALKVTSLAATSLGASDYYLVQQQIEGFNIADLGWGTANAKTVTISAWVYSSLTGTFGGVITNSSFARSYPFSYTISSANTWTQINVTIAGDTSGTWLTTNGVGMQVVFSLGMGSTYSGTAGAWVSATLLSVTGATSVVGTNGATFYITGVQLEKGSTATSFDYRPYGTELALCQRYYWEANQTTYNTNTWATGANSASHNLFTFRYPVEMRTAPTAGIAGGFSVYSAASSGTRNSIATSQIGTQSSRILFTLVGSSGNSCWIDSDSSASKLTFSAEL